MSKEYQVLETKSNTLKKQVENFTVRTQEDYVNIGNLVTDIKVHQQKVQVTFKPLVDSTNKSHKDACALYKKFNDPPKEIRALAEGKMKSWKNEQERKAREEQVRLDEKARKEAARLAARAKKAAEKGQPEKAEDLREQAADREIFKPTVQSSVPKVDGVVLRKNWKFRITDERKVPPQYRMLDLVKIGQQVRVSKGDTKIAGVEVYCE